MFLTATKEDLYKATTKAKRKIRDITNYANDEFSDASDMLIKEIRANPVRSSAIAFGLGVLIAVALCPSKQTK